MGDLHAHDGSDHWREYNLSVTKKGRKVTTGVWAV